MQIEKTYDQLLVDTPEQLKQAKEFMIELNTDKFCSHSEKSNYTYFEKCEEIEDGILNTGLSNVNSLLYYNAIKMLNTFENINRTAGFLEDLYKTNTDEYIAMIFEYMLPVFNKLGEVIDNSIKDDLS